MSDLICSICICALFSENENVSVTPCGHVFHMSCLNQWLSTSETCPLCKSICIASNIIKQLYFNHANEGDNDVQEYNPTIRQLKNKVIDRENKITKLKNEMEKSKKKIHELRKKCESAEEKERQSAKSLRYLKQLRRVSDLDSDMSSPTAQAYLYGLMNQSKDDLIVSHGALCSRIKHAHRELNKVSNMLRGYEEKNRKLMLKLSKLEKQFRSAEREGHVAERRERSTTENNIIVLSSSEDETKSDDDTPLRASSVESSRPMRKVGKTPVRYLRKIDFADYENEEESTNRKTERSTRKGKLPASFDQEDIESISDHYDALNESGMHQGYTLNGYCTEEEMDKVEERSQQMNSSMKRKYLEEDTSQEEFCVEEHDHTDTIRVSKRLHLN